MNPQFLRFLCIRAFYNGLTKVEDGEMNITYVVKPVGHGLYGYQEIWTGDIDFPSWAW